MSSVTKKNNSASSDEIDVGRLIGEFIDHRKLIISVTAIFTLLSILYALFSTPVYKADALIQVEQKQGNAILNSLSQVFPDSQPQSAPEISLLQSRMILGKTVDDLNLQAVVGEKYFPLLGRGWARMVGDKPGALSVSRLYLAKNDKGIAELLLTVVDKDNYTVEYDGKDLKGKVGQLLENKGISLMISDMDAEPGVKFTVSYISKLKAINDLQAFFSVSDQSKDSGMLTLSLTGEDPDLISKIINSISANYLSQNIARQAAQDAKSLDFLNAQLPIVRNELDVSEGKLNKYRQQKDSVDLTLEAKAVLDQIVNADNQINELTFRESEVSQLYTKEHPTYKALLEKKKILQDEKEKLNKRVSSMPETQQEVLKLSRDVESGRAVYMQLLNRQQELNIAKSSAIGNVRIIDDAVTSPHPVEPKKILSIVIGIILGFIVSAGIVLLRVFLHRGIESPEQLEELGINVYASVPVSETLAPVIRGLRKKDEYKEFFLAANNPADLAIEAIRGLRTSLHFAMMEARNNVLMITGASPNAGKTFISSNLAAIIYQANKKILFIDSDMRKGYVHKTFDTNNENGLSDILSGKCTVQQAVKNVASIGFDFISRGMVPPNPAELLMHTRFSELLTWASENYDMVIIDTPPILAVTDAAIIGNYAGTTLMVARFEQNTAKEIEVSVKRFEQSGIHVKGCILNGVVKKASSYYSYGYSDYTYKYKD